MDTRDLALEIIAESVAMEQRWTALAILGALRNLGVALPMDDFRSGTPSITYPKSFPEDALKLDRSMIEGVDEDAETRAVVSGLARALGLAVVAEGAETTGGCINCGRWVATSPSEPFLIEGAHLGGELVVQPAAA